MKKTSCNMWLPVELVASLEAEVNAGKAESVSQLGTMYIEAGKAAMANSKMPKNTKEAFWHFMLTGEWKEPTAVTAVEKIKKQK